jgi:hypothetical protein
MTSILNATLNNNTLAGNLQAAIDLDSSSSSASPLVFNLSGNLIEGNVERAISGAFTGDAPIRLTLTNNQIVGNYGDNSNQGVSFFNFVGTGASTLTAIGNQFNRNTQDGALYIRAGANGDFTGIIQNNFMSENCNAGMILHCDGTNPIEFTFENNTIFGDGSTGMRIFASAANAQLLFVADNNRFIGNSGNGLQIFNDGGTFNSLTTLFTGNLFDGNCGTGLLMSASVTNSLIIESTNNIIRNSCGDGWSLTGTVTDLTFLSTGDLFSGNCESGIRQGKVVGGSTIMVVTNGQFLGNFDGAILLVGNVTQDLTAEFIGSTFIGNHGDGVLVSGSVGNDFTFVASNNQFLGHCGSGIQIDSVPTASAVASTIVIRENTIKDNFGNGVWITANPTSSHTVFVDLNDNTINHQTRNSGNGVAFNYGGSSTGTSTFVSTNNIITDNDTDGILIDVTNSGAGGSLNLVVTDTVTSFNRGNGINVIGDTSNATQFNLTGVFEANIAENNNLSGLSFLSENRAKSVAVVVENIFMNNNPFLSSPNDAGLTMSNTSPNSTLCVAEITGNRSDTGYLLTQTDGTFNLPQTLLEVEADNTGAVNTSGTVNFSTACP